MTLLIATGILLANVAMLLVGSQLISNFMNLNLDRTARVQSRNRAVVTLILGAGLHFTAMVALPLHYFLIMELVFLLAVYTLSRKRGPATV
ncbi:MAG TPA: hypothetical protein P5081_19200 [Phycisphaerae bacterium]|nr:hypothetical protein [Phycisphaerae bacterium]HRW55002.1 hypothetical protein [Phycisphaerae bacterium]